MNDQPRHPPDRSERASLVPAAIVPPGAEGPSRQRPLRTGVFGVLDVGSTKVTCLIGRVDSDGQLRVLGFGWHQSRGVKAGGIIDLDEAERAIRKAVGDAESMADHRLRSVLVNLGCGHPASQLFQVQWPVGGRAVSDQDVRRVVNEGRARAVTEGRDTIHVLPLAFAVDDTPGVPDPRGLHCDTLSARLHVVDAGTTALRNLVLTLERCELTLAELISAPLAAGLSTLVEDERQLGATVIDMGGGTTGMAVFSDGQAIYTSLLGVGGGHVTNDIARVLSTTVVHAERLKTLYGSAVACPDDEREMLPLPLVGEAEHHVGRVPRSQVVNVIRPRLEETFELVRDRLNATGLAHEAGNRVVLTGGASQLSGVRELAGHILDRQVRLGRPHPLRGLPDYASGPGFATAAGLMAWASGAGRSLPDIDVFEETSTGWLKRLANYLRDRV